jgi:hypothetical protein
MGEFLKAMSTDGQHEIYLNVHAIAYAKFHTTKAGEGTQRRAGVFMYGGDHGSFSLWGAHAEALEAAISQHQIGE